MDTHLYVGGLVAYDGTDYHGFQIQRTEPTIQAALEESFAACTGKLSRITGSGRTDTGVHASGQVIAATVQWKHSVADLQNALNANLPGSISIRRLVEASADFHPRFSAEKRTYRYTIYDYDEDMPFPGQARVPKVSPLVDRFALFVPQRLHVTAMQEAAACFVGAHNFLTFGQPPQGENTVRTVYEATWHIVESTLPPLHDYPGRKLVFTVTANAFLRQMVRNLVGTMLVVGKRQWQPSIIPTLIHACDRGRCAPPAPPHGLVLEHVTYPRSVNPWTNQDDTA